MISILQTILTNILKAIYEPFGFAVLLAIFSENLAGNVSEVIRIPKDVPVCFLCGADALPDTVEQKYLEQPVIQCDGRMGTERR